MMTMFPGFDKNVLGKIMNYGIYIFIKALIIIVLTESISLRYLVTITRKILQATSRWQQQRITLSMKQKTSYNTK